MIKKDVISLNQDSREKRKISRAYDGYVKSKLIEKKNRRNISSTVNKNISSGDIIAAVDHEEQVSNVIDGDSKIISAINNLMKRYSVDDMGEAYSTFTGDIDKNTLKDITSSSDTSVNYAPSDPQKNISPKDELAYLYRTKKQQTVRETYKIPKDAPKINTAINSYKDRRSMRYLTDDNIAEISEAGIITVKQGISDMPSYKLISEEDLIQVPIDSTPEQISPYSYKNVTAGQDSYHEDTIIDPITANRDTRYYYQIGIDDIFLGRKVIDSAGGFVSSEIDVEDCIWISLSADCETAEYYILDGTSEIPILPDTQEKIVGEKLFFGHMPRFSIQDQQNFTVKKNGVITSINDMIDLQLFLMSQTSEDGKSSFETVNDYTIDYFPLLSHRRYTPKNTTIRLKIILRKNGNEIPKITKCQINIHNPDSKWPLSSIEDLRINTGSW